MKKRNQIISLVLSMTLLCCGCGSTKTDEDNTPSGTSTTTEEDAYQNKLDVLRPFAYGSVEGLDLEPGSYISIIGRYSDDSYWKEVEKGAKKAVEDINTMLGYKGNDKVKLTYSSPSDRDDVDEQVNILDEELARYPAAICIASVDAAACQIQFELANDNGIPIISFDSGTNYQDITAHVATNNMEAAQTAATKLADLMEGTGEIAVFVQDSVSTTASDREQGFTDTIAANYPDVSVVNIYHMDELSSMAQTIVAEQNAALEENATPVEASSITQKDVVKYILEKNPNLKGIYATNLDATQLVAGVLESLDRDDLYFVGFDGGEEQLELLENDVVDGLILQNPYGMGYATVVAAARSALGLGNEAFVDSGYTWVTQDNMDDSSIELMLY